MADAAVISSVLCRPNYLKLYSDNFFIFSKLTTRKERLLPLLKHTTFLVKNNTKYYNIKFAIKCNFNQFSDK